MISRKADYDLFQIIPTNSIYITSIVTLHAVLYFAAAIIDNASDAYYNIKNNMGNYRLLYVKIDETESHSLCDPEKRQRKGGMTGSNTT